MAKKVILFGGTFDPIHFGHMTVAQSAVEQTGAEKIVFIPAKRSPHKKVFPVADGKSRVEMISRSIEGREDFEVSECELHRDEPSYTLDTVRFFRGEYGSAVKLYWLVGADAVRDLAGWYGIRDLMEECHLSVMYRGGFERPCFSGFEGQLGLEGVEKLNRNVIKTPLVEISGTEIRSKLALGEDIEGLVGPAVAEYIAENGLYRG